MMRTIINGLYQLWGTGANGECQKIDFVQEKPMFKMCVKGVESLRDEYPKLPFTEGQGTLCPNGTIPFTQVATPQVLLTERPWRLKTDGNLRLNSVLESILDSVAGEKGDGLVPYAGVILITEAFTDAYRWELEGSKKIVMLQHLA